MKRKHLIAALITVAVIVGSLAFPAFAEATQTAEDPASSVASQDSVPTSSAPPPSSEPAPVPSESVSSSTEPEEPSSVYEEPSSQYYISESSSGNGTTQSIYSRCSKSYQNWTGYCRSKAIWETSHTFRRSNYNYRYIFPERRCATSI